MGLGDQGSGGADGERNRCLPAPGGAGASCGRTNARANIRPSQQGRRDVASRGTCDRLSEARTTMLSQENILSTTPVGAELVPGGASFRFWAPSAMAVYLNGVFGDRVYDQQTEDRLLKKDASGHWSGFQEDARDGDKYRFWVNGEG